MNHEILLNRKVNIKGKEILIKEIEKIDDLINGASFKINGGVTYSKFDIGMAVNITKADIEAEEKKNLNIFKKLRNKFGLFHHTHISEVHGEFGLGFGKRTFGYHTAGFFIVLNFGKTRKTLEIVINDKEEYENGSMPYSLIRLEKLF